MLQTPGTAEFESLLKESCGDALISVESHYDITVATVSPGVLFDVLRMLKEAGYTFLTSCHGMHYPDKEQPFAMVYHLHDLPRNLRVRIKAFTEKDPPVFPSLIPLFAGANWMERETFDFFGFQFTGHPNLTRILNMDDMEGWPLRKEYPLEDQARYDKDDKMFGR